MSVKTKTLSVKHIFNSNANEKFQIVLANI